MKYNGKVYYYVLNAQGDVVRIVDGSRNVVASYSYDPWGKLLSSSGTLANVNPLRYRGYYYDTETGFYYLQSRYYDPEIGRFINADSYASTDATGLLSTNMFAYCENDPVNKSDPTGDVLLEMMLIGAATGVIRQMVIDVACNAIAGRPLDDLSSIGTYAAAAFSGALSAIPGGGIATAVVDLIGSSLISEGIDALHEKREFSWSNVGMDMAVSAVQAGAGNYINSCAPKHLKDIKPEAKRLGITKKNQFESFLKKKQSRYHRASKLFNLFVDAGRTYYRLNKR